ncbi:MFS transporter [Microbacterium sp. X-17]|uniref:MFS transporter n=1 Tax=Microbacterium sp. X-17 TaxID=3144404 RepID=UPI0031F4CEF2
MSFPPSPSPRLTGGRLVALTVAVLFAAAMMRAPIVAVAPVADEVEAALGITPAVVGLFTSIPVLAFALCSPLAVAIIRRGGADFALSVCLIGGIAGTLVRSAGSLAAALVGTAIIGLFLTIGNVVVPLIIAREFPPERVQVMSGVYASALNVGTMTVTIATAPLATGIGWQGAIAVWAGFGLVALGVWIGLHGLRGALVPARPALAQRPRGSSGILRVPTTWLLAAAFAGQSFCFYGMTAWLPSLLAAQGFGGTAAGAISAVFQVGGIAGALTLPLVTTRFSIAAGVVAAAVGWVILPLGFLVAPELWLLWCIVGGLAQGAGFTVVIILITALGGGVHAIAGRSGFVQGAGYALAATGPVALGALHEVTGAWAVPLVVVFAAGAMFGIAGILVALPLRRRPAR